MVAILLAASRVASGGLQMTVLYGADPHIGPRGRNHQRPNAGEGLRAANAPALHVEIDEAFAVRLLADARPFIAHVTQACLGRGIDRIDANRRFRLFDDSGHARR